MALPEVDALQSVEGDALLFEVRGELRAREGQRRERTARALSTYLGEADTLVIDKPLVVRSRGMEVAIGAAAVTDPFETDLSLAGDRRTFVVQVYLVVHEFDVGVVLLVIVVDLYDTAGHVSEPEQREREGDLPHDRRLRRQYPCAS